MSDPLMHHAPLCYCRTLAGWQPAARSRQCSPRRLSREEQAMACLVVVICVLNHEAVHVQNRNGTGVPYIPKNAQ